MHVDGNQAPYLKASQSSKTVGDKQAPRKPDVSERLIALGQLYQQRRKILKDQQDMLSRMEEEKIVQ